MASNWNVVRLIITSCYKDFSKERDILLKEVIPDFKAWAETRKIQIVETDVRWGSPNPRHCDVQRLRDEVSQLYFQDVMPYFINLTSENIGLIPMWGDASEQIVEDFQKRLDISQAEMEVLFAAYRDDNPNCLFMQRDDRFMDDLTLKEEKKYFLPQETIPHKCQKISQEILKKYSTTQLIKYQYDCAGWDHCENKMRVEMGPSFRKQVLQFLKGRVCEEFPAGPSVNNLHQQMRESQEAFMKARSIKVRGRNDIVQRIEEYIFTGEKDVPLVLLGGAGCGKSSIMAKTADHMLCQAEKGCIPGGGERGWHVFPHFVGAVPRSTELGFMLKQLLQDIGITIEPGRAKDTDALAQLCCSALSNPNTRPIIVMVDAINQFDEEHAALVMSWVPRKLAPQIRCIFSMIPDTMQHRTLMARESKPHELLLAPLDLESRKLIVQEMLGAYSHRLSSNQLDSLLAKQSSDNPLWLSVACEELHQVEDPRDIDEAISNLADGLLNLLETVLERFEQEGGGHLLVATLCLLEASRSGLLESELLDILGEEDSLTPPSPFDEKEEKELLEKECEGKEKGPLSDDSWNRVYRTLRPFLRPYGDSREGRLDFYHRALSKAVRRKYFEKQDENIPEDESQNIYSFWHQKLADFFEKCENIDRKAEEYLYHLVKVDDQERLTRCLCDWSMLDKLYNEEYSGELLSYWRKVGGALEMISSYREALTALEEREPCDDQLIALRYEHVARVFLQAGKYCESLDLAKQGLKMEEKELGNRKDRMVDLYGLMAEIYDEKLKLNDFVSPSQLPDLRKTITYGRKSIALRKSLLGDYHRFKLAMSLMRLAFSLESWEACGGDSQLPGEEALREGNEHIDTTILIFQELKDDGHYAEALMTKGVLATRGSMEQLKFYNQAMEICMQVYGEESLLTSRLYINIGIVYEDNKDYVKAYEFFCKWARVSEAVLGPEHPKTLRAKGVLKEPRYQLVALRLFEQSPNQPQENNAIEEAPNEEAINQEVENLDDFDDEHFNSNIDAPEGDDSNEIDHLQEDFIAVTEELQQAIDELLTRVSLAEQDNNPDNRRDDALGDT